MGWLYIHLHEWLICMVNVTKYTSPMDGMGACSQAKQILKKQWSFWEDSPMRCDEIACNITTWNTINRRMCISEIFQGTFHSTNWLNRMELMINPSKTKMEPKVMGVWFKFFSASIGWSLGQPCYLSNSQELYLASPKLPEFWRPFDKTMGS